jgi:hypothetical protein
LPDESAYARNITLALCHFDGEVEAHSPVSELLILKLWFLPQHMMEHIYCPSEGGKAEVKFNHQLLQNLVDNRIQFQRLHLLEIGGSVVQGLEKNHSVDEMRVSIFLALHTIDT